jgi:hypothetical protein
MLLDHDPEVTFLLAAPVLQGQILLKFEFFCCLKRDLILDTKFSWVCLGGNLLSREGSIFAELVPVLTVLQRFRLLT